MKPYIARPVMRTRFQPAVSLMTQPVWPVMNPSRDLMASNPSTNILRLENGYQIQLAVPGVPKNQIQLQVLEGKLVISTKNENKENTQRFVRKEFDFSNFSRTFTLHKNADLENLKASFENGILTITIPDKEPETRKIEIQ